MRLNHQNKFEGVREIVERYCLKTILLFLELIVDSKMTACIVQFDDRYVFDI